MKNHKSIKFAVAAFIVAAAFSSCVTTTTTAPDGTVTVVRGVDAATVETITSGIVIVGSQRVEYSGK